MVPCNAIDAGETREHAPKEAPMRRIGSRWFSLVCAIALAGCQAGPDGSAPAPDVETAEAAATHGVPVDVLEAAGLPRELDARHTASVLADCAVAEGVAGDDFASWTPALDCLAAVDLEIAETIHGFGGERISANEIAWADDGPILLVPVKDHAEGTANCPSGYFCFYQYTSYGGKRLAYKASSTYSWFGNYGMQDKISSWHNNSTGVRRLIYNRKWAGLDDLNLWTLWGSPGAPTRDAAVDASDDNRADYFSR